MTNDDGVHAPGVKALHEAVSTLGHAITVAPERDNSAVSHSLTMNRPLKVEQIASDVYSVNGTPTDCVTIALNKILESRPVLLVSGINPGGNLGDDISYSGTVSAAIEGTMYEIPSLAFSLAGNQPFDFTTAASVAWKMASMALAFKLPPRSLLNVNIPNCPAGDIQGVLFTRQGRRRYKDSIQETFDPWGRKHYWIGGGTVHWAEDEGSDEMAIRNQYISVTPIQLDLTNHIGLGYLQQYWKS